ncbi:hypothetical protein CDG76_19330 [Nostoc sp. 'Peltigera membranacea cyanobiont' 210A]|nr:hypothetical protein CDG76_19330 [Nostoc sp. 'Peltigera membranacea cyanobiont' 210A]
MKRAFLGRGSRGSRGSEEKTLVFFMTVIALNTLISFSSPASPASPAPPAHKIALLPITPYKGGKLEILLPPQYIRGGLGRGDSTIFARGLLLTALPFFMYLELAFISR